MPFGLPKDRKAFLFSVQRGKSVVARDLDQVAGIVESKNADVPRAANLEAVDAAI